MNTTESPTQVNATFSLNFCFLFDYPLSGIDCSRNDSTGPRCARCYLRGTYFTGESINDYDSVALIYIYVIWALTILVSALGILANTFILLILKQRVNKISFDILLSVLAMYDLLCSFVAGIESTGSMSFYANWFGRGQGSMYWYMLSFFGAMATRTGSTFMTVLITIERFLAITYPFKASTWFTRRNNKIMSMGILLLTILINYPRFASYEVQKNDFQDLPSLESLSCIIMRTEQEQFWYNTLYGIHNKIDFWLPLPIILLFNLLSYLKIEELSKLRKTIPTNLRKDIRAVKMFIPVVVVNFCTHMAAVSFYIVMDFTHLMSRDTYQLLVLGVAVNAMVNLPIYCWTSALFKKEIWGILGLRLTECRPSFYSQLIYRRRLSSDNSRVIFVD